MKKNINLGIQYALCLLLLGFYGCKSEERGETDYSVKTEVGGVLFSLQERDFGADVETGTRATELAKPQTMDLGEGLEAEVSVEQEAALAETRASKPLSNGTYTIVAFKDGTRIGQKHTATVSGGNLSITSNGVRPQFSWLTDGTYTFVCYNDKVTDDGAHSFTVTREDVVRCARRAD